MGTGTLVIENGGAVHSADGWIGGHKGKSGTLLDSAEMLVAEDVQKILHPGGTNSGNEANPAVPKTSTAILGEGTVRVSGTGSAWTNSRTLTLGASGNGRLVIAEGGRVSVHDGAGTIGLATVLSTTGTIHIGAESSDPNKATGAGSLEVATIAFGTGAGTLNFNHTDSNYDFGTALTSTGSGTQKLNHYAGVTRLTGDSSNFWGDTTVSGGTLAVSGKLGRAGPLTVSLGGFGVGKNVAGSVTVERTGKLVIKDGGSVSSSDGWIGAHEGSSGTVTGSIEESIEALVGHTLPGVFKSAGTGGHSEVVVSGTGSAWTNSNTLTVGSSGQGSLVIAEGGRVSVQDGAGTVGLASLGGGGGGTIYIGAASLDPKKATGAGRLEAKMVKFGGGAGTLHFNHNESDYDFSAALSSTHPALSSTPSGTPKLDLYAGVTRLTADSSSFGGTTTVSGGTLVVADKLGGDAFVNGGRFQVDGNFAGPVTVKPAGTLTGAGTIGGDVVFADGVLAGAQDQTLKISGNLKLDNASQVNVVRGGALSEVGGDLQLGGKLNVSDKGAFGAGVYRLFGYGGALSGNGLTFGTIPADVNAKHLGIQTSVKGQVNLAMTDGMNLGYWDGDNAALHGNNAVDGGAGIWRVDGASWTDVDGVVNGPFPSNPSFAVFQGTAATVTVDDLAGDVSMTGMQIATDGYRIKGQWIVLQGQDGESVIRVGDGTKASTGMTGTIASGLKGDSKLVISDYGTLVLKGGNVYTGGTQINSGVLSVSENTNLGMAVSELILNGGALTTTASFDTARAVTLEKAGVVDVSGNTELGLTGTITGSGQLIKRGSGSLTLSGINTYKGGVAVDSGTLRAEGIGAFVADSAYVVNGGKLDLDAYDLQMSSLSGEGGTVALNGANLTLDQGIDTAYAGDILGKGAFLKKGTGTLILSGSNAYTGDTTISGGTLQFGNGTVAARNKLDGDIFMTAGSRLAVVTPATVKVSGMVALPDDTSLSIGTALGGAPSLTAASMSLGKNVELKLTGITTEKPFEQVLIDTTGGIMGDFINVSIESPVDYLTMATKKSTDGNQYLAAYGLTWMAANNLAHGTFTLANADDSFTANTALTDQAGNPGPAIKWDGKTLTKRGDGTLVLAGKNSYTGGTRVDSGVLSVSDDTNLGAGSGGLILNGGTLASTASFDTARAVTLEQASGVDVIGNTELRLTGTINGSGELTKRGDGALVLTGTNAYGNTRVEAGRLIGNASSISGDLLNDDSVIFDQPVDAAYAGKITGSGSMTKRGTEALTLMGISEQPWLIETGTLISSADRYTGDTQIEATGTLRFDQVSNAAYAGVLSGSGAFTKTGDGQLTMTGANTYTGDTTISGGTLQFGDGTVAASNTLGGNISVATGGQLAVVTPATVKVGGKVELSDGTSLLIGTASGADISLTAASVSLGNNVGLKFTGAAAASPFELVVIDTTAGIEGDFSNVSVESPVDYLTMATKKSKDGNQYLAKYGLAWMASNSLAHGTFTLANADDSFTVDTALTDQAANPVPAINWDGKTLTKQGSGTLVLAGKNSYTGDTVVSGGTLLVNGSIASSAMTTVAAGATLGGSGTLGTTKIASDATLAPGGVDTTLTVDGDLTIASGATYQVHADSSSARSTLVKVTGAALLEGGTVMHVGPDDAYLPNTGYTILTADKGVTGQFVGGESAYAYLTPSLAYTPTTVTMELVRRSEPFSSRAGSMRFANAGNTGNQRATADAVESLGRGNDLYQRIEALPSGAPPAVFNSLSGEAHASANAALQSSATGARTLTFKHLRNNLSAAARPGSPTAQAGASDAPVPMSSLPQDGALPAWAEIVGNWQTLSGDGNSARATQHTGGVFVGGDHPVGNGWRLGGALGYTDSTLRVKDRNARSGIKSYSATLYGGKTFETDGGNLNVLVGAGYSWHNVDSRRRIDAAGLNQSLKADYRANTSQLFAELGYAVPAGDATLEPFAGVAWSDLRTRGFSESGGSAALSSRSQTNDQTTTTLGLRAQAPFDAGQGSGTVRGSVGWRHAFGTLAPRSTLAFSGSQPFTVAGTPMARDVALLELGADIAISRNATLGVSYGGEFGKRSRENSGAVIMRWRF